MKLSLVLTLGVFTFGIARAEAAPELNATPVAQVKVMDLGEVAGVVAGQEIRVEERSSLTVITTADEQSYAVDEPAASVADQLCGDRPRPYDFGRGKVILCTAHTRD